MHFLCLGLMCLFSLGLFIIISAEETSIHASRLLKLNYNNGTESFEEDYLLKKKIGTCGAQCTSGTQCFSICRECWFGRCV